MPNKELFKEALVHLWSLVQVAPLGLLGVPLQAIRPKSV